MSKLGRKNNDAVFNQFKSKLLLFTGSNLVINYKTESQEVCSLKFRIQTEFLMMNFLLIIVFLFPETVICRQFTGIREIIFLRL